MVYYHALPSAVSFVSVLQLLLLFVVPDLAKLPSPASARVPAYEGEGVAKDLRSRPQHLLSKFT